MNENLDIDLLLDLFDIVSQCRFCCLKSKSFFCDSCIFSFNDCKSCSLTFLYWGFRSILDKLGISYE